MNIPFSKTYKKISMYNEQEKDIAKWFVMRAYKNEKKAEEHLSREYGLKYFIPKQKLLRKINGKKVLVTVPVIRSLIFVFAKQEQIVDFKLNYYNDLQFVTRTFEGKHIYITVPNKEMENFIKVCEQKEEELNFFKPEELLDEKKRKIVKGQRVKVHGGPFNEVEGFFMKVEKKRGRQLVVIIPDLLAVSAEIDPDYLEILE